MISVIATGVSLSGSLFGYGLLAPSPKIHHEPIVNPAIGRSAFIDWCSLITLNAVVDLFICTIALGTLSGCLWVTTEVCSILRRLDAGSEDVVPEETRVVDEKFVLV